MDVLQRNYAIKRGEYEALIASEHPDPAKIAKLNGELSALLTSMLTELGKVKEEAGHIEHYREELVKKLVAVQKDFNGLVSDRDQISTLKALRGHQEARFNSTFVWYATALIIVSIVFFFVLMWKGRYKAPTMPTMMSSATTMDPFTYR